MGYCILRRPLLRVLRRGAGVAVLFAVLSCYGSEFPYGDRRAHWHGVFHRGPFGAARPLCPLPLQTHDDRRVPVAANRDCDVLRHAVFDSEGNAVKAEVALTYGNFIQSVIDFLIIALSIFLFLRIAMNLRNKFEAAKAKLLQEEKEKQKDEAEKEEAEAPKPSEEVLLLSEIRDLIKNQAEEKN